MKHIDETYSKRLRRQKFVSLFFLLAIPAAVWLKLIFDMPGGVYGNTVTSIIGAAILMLGPLFMLSALEAFLAQFTARGVTAASDSSVARLNSQTSSSLTKLGYASATIYGVALIWLLATAVVAAALGLYAISFSLCATALFPIGRLMNYASFVSAGHENLYHPSPFRWPVI